MSVFLGRNFSFLPSLVELHGKKRGTILKILPWSLKSMSVNKLVVVKTFNGFFIFILMKHFHILQLKKSLFFIQIVVVNKCSTQRYDAKRDDWTLKETKIFQNHQIIKSRNNSRFWFHVNPKIPPLLKPTQILRFVLCILHVHSVWSISIGL